MQTADFFQAWLQEHVVVVHESLVVALRHWVHGSMPSGVERWQKVEPVKHWMEGWHLF